jgi:hypothetical protein
MSSQRRQTDATNLMECLRHLIGADSALEPASVRLGSAGNFDLYDAVDHPTVGRGLARSRRVRHYREIWRLRSENWDRRWWDADQINADVIPCNRRGSAVCSTQSVAQP